MEVMIKLFVMISLILGLVTVPYFSKKDIHFGVRIPNSDRKKLKKIRVKFIVLNIIFGIIATYMMLVIKDPLVGIVGVTFAYLGVAMVIYILAYNEAKSLKKEILAQNSPAKKRQITVVDTDFTNEKGKKMRVSPFYFIVPLLIILIVTIISLVNYDLIPDAMPMHYNAYGEVDNWTEKTYLSVLMLPIVSLAMTGMFYWIYLVIGKSKQQISANNPHISAKQNRKHRKIWSSYMIASAVLMTILFGYLQLIMIRNPAGEVGEMMVVTLGMTLIMIISSILLAVYTGNGGGKLKIKGEAIKDSTEEESDDDQYWKLGTIYYNPGDPSVFVDKRVGIGWTINMATVKGKLFVVGTIVFTIAVVVISIWNT